MAEIIYADESYAIIGACFDVSNNKGCGFLEPVYQECLEMELSAQRIPYTAQPSLKLEYRGRILKHTYTPDFVCYGKIILEIKAVSALVDEHRAQVLNYLHATGFRPGLLVNFGSYPNMEYERIVLTGKKAGLVEHPVLPDSCKFV